LLSLFIIFPAKFSGRHDAEEKANTILLFLIHNLSFPLKDKELRKTCLSEVKNLQHLQRNLEKLIYDVMKILFNYCSFQVLVYSFYVPHDLKNLLSMLHLVYKHFILYWIPLVLGSILQRIRYCMSML